MTSINLRSLIVLLLFSIVQNSIAASGQQIFSVKSVDLGAPDYRRFSSLWISTDIPKNQSFILRFEDANGVDMGEKYSVKARAVDYKLCDGGICQLQIFELPVQLERISCSIVLDAKDLDSSSESQTKISWGACEQKPSAPGLRFLPDFFISEDTTVEQDGTFGISNSGYAIHERDVSTFGFILDRDGNVIWSDYKVTDLSLETNGTYIEKFQAPIRAWQVAQGCTAYVIIDPDHRFVEKSKRNNMLRFNFGHCEEQPSIERGDGVDLSISLEVGYPLYHIIVKNNGKLPVRSEISPIEVSIQVFDVSRNLLRAQTVQSSDFLFGYGDTLRLPVNFVGPDACLVKMDVNPSWTIKETNYNNNKFDLETCK